MDKKGIKTEKGEFNRWIRATIAFIRNLRKSIAALSETIKKIKFDKAKVFGIIGLIALVMLGSIGLNVACLVIIIEFVPNDINVPTL